MTDDSFGQSAAATSSCVTGIPAPEQGYGDQSMQRAGTNPKNIKVDDKDDQEVFVTTVMQGTAPTGSRISDCQGGTVNYIGMQLCTATVLPYAWSNLE